MAHILRRADFRLLFAGLVASMVGDSMMMIVFAIWVKDLTGSNSLAGLTILALVVPSVAAPVLGWLVDRFRRRPFLVVANLVSALALTPLLAVHTRSDVRIIYLVTMLYGVSYIVLSSALSALVKEMVPDDLLAQANAVQQTAKQGLRLVGPPLGAALYVAAGGSAVAALDAASFIVAALVVLALRIREDRPKPGELHWTAEIAAGLRHLLGQPALRRVTLGFAFAVLTMGFAETLAFAYVDQGLHRPPAFLGVLMPAMGVGGALGGLGSSIVVRRLGEVGAVSAGLATAALGAAMMLYPTVALGLAALLLFGMGVPVAVVGSVTIVQRLTPAALLGRVSAASDALTSTPQAVSIGLGAALISVVDYRLLFAAMVVGMLSAAAWLWVGRRVTPTRATPEASVAPMVAE